MTRAEVKAKRAVALAARRNAEANDALDFLFLGDDEGRHSAKCLHALAGGEACSRDYDPMPYPEAAPVDPRVYEGTGIAALYGIPGGEAHAWQLAGWNVRPRRSLSPEARDAIRQGQYRRREEESTI